MNRATFLLPLLALALPALAQRPGDRQSVSGIHPSYAVTNIKPAALTWAVGGMDFLSDGRLVITSWRDPYEVYIFSSEISGSNPTTATMTKFATGLSESLGLKVVNDSIYVLEKDQITLLLDHDKNGIADEYRAISYDWTKSVNSKEYAIGLVYDGTWFYAAFGDPTISSGTSVDPVPAGRQNGVLRVRRSDGHTEVFAGGLRVPGSMGMAYGQVWVTEIQGGYRPSNVLYNPKAGRWYGRPINQPSVFQPATVPNHNQNPNPYSNVTQLYTSAGYNATPFSANIPFKISATNTGGGPAGLQRSTAGFVEMKTGPFAGQLLIAESDRGETGSGEMVRVFLEQMPNGEYQGAVFHFTRNTAFGGNATNGRACFSMIEGPGGAFYCSGNGATSAGWSRATNVGLDRIQPTGAAVPFDILAVRSKGPTTFEFEFTKPLNASLGNDVSANLVVQTWWDKLSETYGCCRSNEANANGVTTKTGYTATVQSDRSKVLVTFPAQLALYWNYYFRWTDVMRSSANDSLYGTEAWYTLNAYGPGTAPVAVTPAASRTSGEAPFTMSRLAGGSYSLRFNLASTVPYKVSVAGLNGQIMTTRRGAGSTEVLLKSGDLPTGVGVIRVDADGSSYSRLVSR